MWGPVSCERTGGRTEAGSEGIEAEWVEFECEVRKALLAIAARMPDLSRNVLTRVMSIGGKGLRPRLLFYTARLGVPDRQALVQAAALVELLHVGSLLHDDVIDQAEERRGLRAGHALYGREVSVLSGVLAFTEAWRIAIALGEEPHRLVASAAATLANGELADCDRAFDQTLGRDEYLHLVAQKTATLFLLPCQLACTLASLTAQQATMLAHFALLLGAAFQVIDDCLDLTRDTDSGKPSGTDHRRGLYGAPTLLALGQRTRAAREIGSIIFGERLGDEDLQRLSEAVARADGFRAAGRLAYEMLDDAGRLLTQLPEGPARSGLAKLANQLEEKAIVAGA